MAVVAGSLGSLPGLMSLRHQRRASEAGAAGEITESALKLLEANEHRVQLIEKEFEAYRQKTQKEIFDLREEQRLQEVQLDNNIAFASKLHMVITILQLQLKERGIEPAIDISQITTISIAQLRRTAEYFSKLVHNPGSPKDTLILKGGD